MRQLTLIIFAALMLAGCNNITKKTTPKSEEKKETTPLKDVTLTFKGIEIGKNINDIDKSCFENNGEIDSRSLELIPYLRCSLEKLRKEFCTTIIAGKDNHKYACKVFVYTEKDSDIITKLVCYIPNRNYNTYLDIYDLYRDKYGEEKYHKRLTYMPFETNLSSYVFAKNKRITIANRDYIGEASGAFAEIARIGKLKNCVEIVYYDNTIKIKENNLKAEAKKKAAEANAKKNQELQQQKKDQDI